MRGNVSKKLVKFLRQKISTNNGSLSFSDFMQAVLYTPGLGYYVAGKYKFGARGDFVTAPEISPLFAICITKQCQQVLNELAGGDILEFGAGSGVMAGVILSSLAKQDCLPEKYFILELSPDLQSLQRETLRAMCPKLLDRVQWLSALPHEFTGVMLANEVMDAFPVTIFNWDGKQFFERRITYNEKNKQFFWQNNNIIRSNELQAALQVLPQNNFGDNYISEISLLLKPWVHSLSTSLQRGMILLIDYGFCRAEYYHPQRNRGTLMCHYQHRAHDDPLLNIGLQDITAHIDFTLVAEAASAAGLAVSGYTNQANFLLNCGILSRYQEFLPSDKLAKINAQQQLNKLLQPQEMGELFKCIALLRKIDLSLLGFETGDRRGSL